jgi:hypothetical protein
MSSWIQAAGDMIILFLHHRMSFGFLMVIPLWSSAPASAVEPATVCSHYASSAGNGDGSSPSKPFRISRFWSVAQPGMSLCLLDGIYKGADSMITPPPRVSGTQELPIVIRALNDGKVLIDGESARRPVFFSSNDWIVLEGVNACCSNRSVIELTNSSNDTIRRVAAWDALDGNEKIFGIHHGTHNLLEDVAGWGTARKIFEFSYGGDSTTVRRAWGRWERSTVQGPKMVYSLAYNNFDTLLENCLGTWSGEGMPESYVLRDFYGKPWTGAHAGSHRGDDIEGVQGIFSVDGVPAGQQARARLVGSLAYLVPGDKFTYNRLILVTKTSGIQIDNTVAYYPSELGDSKFTFSLYPLADGSGPSNVSATSITSFGGSGLEIKAGWTVRNELHGPTPQAVYRAGESVFTTSRGAELCRRYVDGARTEQPLWPWPMNQRIIDAMTQSGRRPVDVTAQVERMFGGIPSQCRSPGAGETSPQRPVEH